MTRPSSVEFSGKTKDKAAARANGRCEKCRLPFAGRRPHYDHILPAALGGKPELSNCQALCEPCHKEKTGKEDVPRIRKADRQRKAATGARRETAPITSRGFEPADKPSKIAKGGKIDKGAIAALGRRSLFTDA